MGSLYKSLNCCRSRPIFLRGFCARPAAEALVVVVVCLAVARTMLVQGVRMFCAAQKHRPDAETWTSMVGVGVALVVVVVGASVVSVPSMVWVM